VNLVPRVDHSDVVRIVQRDFPPEQHATVVALLDEYGRQSWHREIHRVQLAILKLSRGDVHEVGAYVEAANIDFRDVIASAEYPRWLRAGPVKLAARTSEQDSLMSQDDANEYTAWLSRI
jgi:hypothetical protein